MLIEPKPRKEYEKPKPGIHLAVLADAIYQKNVPTQFGLKNQTKYIWLLQKKDAEGNHFQVRSRWMNDTTDPAGSLYKLSTSIQNGTPIPPSFDPESLLGKVNQLGVIHAQGTDKRTGKPVTYVNVSSVNPADEGQTFPIPANYVREKDRPARGSQPAQAAAGASATASSPAGAASQEDTSDEVEF